MGGFSNEGRAFNTAHKQKERKRQTQNTKGSWKRRQTNKRLQRSVRTIREVMKRSCFELVHICVFRKMVMRSFVVSASIQSMNAWNEFSHACMHLHPSLHVKVQLGEWYRLSSFADFPFVCRMFACFPILQNCITTYYGLVLQIWGMFMGMFTNVLQWFTIVLHNLRTKLRLCR